MDPLRQFRQRAGVGLRTAGEELPHIIAVGELQRAGQLPVNGVVHNDIQYQSVKQKVGFDALVNMKCRAYEDLYMAYITPDAREEKLLEHPELFVTPIVRNGREATVGYHPEIWQTWE